MNMISKTTPTRLVLILTLTIMICLCAFGCSSEGKIQEILTEEEYSYVNPDESKADTDAGMVIDGVLDETQYQNNQWLYLHNDEGGNNVDIAMTSYFGEKGMYFVYDVTESVPIYVNLDRASYLNSCIEMYFAPSSVTSLKQNSYFEVDMLPTGDMMFKKSNGKGGYVNVATTDDIMAHLGATTKGGDVNTPECYGYSLELFVPWEYMTRLGLDAQEMQNGFVYVDPAHITSYNLLGTDTSVDRYWYFFAQQQGAGFGDVGQYFRFDGSGVIGTVPVTADQAEHCTIAADPYVIPGVQNTVTVTPESGYALTSVLVDGKEMIQQVNFTQDGAATLAVRSGNQGMVISAQAQSVTAGNKTLSGSIMLQKPGGDTLTGVVVSYKGPTGEKPVEIDANGKFMLTDLQQGYYTVTAEKEGYPTVQRSIYLNQDLETVITLKYDTFFAEKGTCWVLDQQNEGILSKFGGSGYLLTNQSYNSFTFRAKFRYDTELAKEADTDYFYQQRSGMRILFSNGKYWHMDLLHENGKYIVQYAKHSGDGSVFGWKGICEMNASQVAQYCSQEGIELTLTRQGQYAGIWLDGTLIAIEKLANEYASCTAQLGFESWIANRNIMQIPYSISSSTSVDLSKAVFQKTGKWDVSGMFSGYLTNPAGTADTDWTNTYNQAYRQITLTVSDRTPAANNFKVAVHFAFSNGQTFRIGLTNADTGELGTYKVQVLEANSIIKNWATKYRLSSEQIAKLQSQEGMQFRVAVVGSQANIYLDNVQVCAIDLSKDLEGNDTNIADKNAKIGVRIYGNEGVTTKVPFVLGGTVKTSQIVLAQGSQAVIQGSNHIIGETVVIKPMDGGCELVSVSIDGNPVELTSPDSYSFTATAATHTVEALSKRVRVWNPKNQEWDLSSQTSDLIKIPASDGDSGWLETYSADYDDVDLQLTLRDQDTAAGNYRAAVRFAFANGEYVTFTLTNAKATDDEPTVYELQNMGGSILNWYQVKGFRLSDQQVAKLQSEDGLSMRVVRKGAWVDIYLDGQHAYEFDLFVNKDGNPSNVEQQPTNIQLRFYGNQGKDVSVPYSLETEVKTVEVTVAEIANGTVTTDQKQYIADDQVILHLQGDSGFYYTDLQVNGQSVVTDADGSYSFTAQQDSYQISAVFAKGVFLADKDQTWNLINQNQGVLHVSKNQNGAAWMQTEGNYNELTLTVRDFAGGSVHEYAVVGQLYFANGKYISIRLIYDKNNDRYTLQSMGDSVANWATHHTLSAEQYAKVRGEGIRFTMQRVGTSCHLYLDDVLVKTVDLTGRSSGITAAMTCVAKVRYYNNKGYAVTLPYALGNPQQTGTVTVTACDHGTITADKTTYHIGETVTLTVSGEDGYYHNGLNINGQIVLPNADGTYSFTASEASYTVSTQFTQVYSWTLPITPGI